MGGDSAMDKMKGKAKEAAGKARGDERMKAEGRADQAKGRAKKAGQEAKDKARGVKDSMTDRDET